MDATHNHLKDYPLTCTPKQGASLLGDGSISDRTLRRMAEDGRIRGVRIGSRWVLNTASLLEAFGIVEA